MNVVLLIVLAVALMAIVAVRRAGWLPGRRVLPRSSRTGNRTTRIAEAVMLLCAATAIFVFTATNTSTGGRLLILDQLRPGFAMVNVIVAVCAGLGVLLGVLAALFWRTSTGVIVAAGVLCVYGFVLNGPEIILESLAPRESTVPKGSLTFLLSTPDVEGAELYVNGIHLGTLPYQTSHEEFFQSVPVWTEEPNENDEQFRLSIRSYGGPHSGGSSHYRPWARIQVPEPPGPWNQRGRTDYRTYYARVKLGDTWGFSNGHSGGGGGGGGRYEQRTATVGLGFIFPTRQERIEKLLDLARLNDYSPDPEWFTAMETYRSDGWIAVQEAMNEEPAMAQVLDAWATWKYDLDKVTDPESAWKVFERIREEADQRGYYQTSDIAGRAVELLTPKLDPARLVGLARHFIQSTRFYSWNTWQMNGRTQFGMSFNPGGFHTGADSISFMMTGGRGEQLQPGGYAVAHAVWMLDDLLDARDDTQPTIVERELVPVFVARNYDRMNFLRFAAHIGGPAVEQYLLRQNWEAAPENLSWGERMRLSGYEVNGWLYLLAHLRSPTGRQFRQEHQRHLMEMADRLVEQPSPSDLPEGIDFLFLDLDLRGNSLAMKYWPRFKSAADREKYGGLSLQCQYLLRMEPLATVDMYVQCWKEFRGRDHEFEMALTALAKSSLPYDKRQRIHAALVEHVQRDVGNVEITHGDQQSLREYLLRNLDETLLSIGDEERAGDLLAELQAAGPAAKPERVAEWLARGEPGHPLVGMLADANEPSLRLLVMGVLREHPTPANRAILRKLLQDGDEQVRGVAEAVAEELAILKETPVAQLADRRAGPAVP